MYGRTAQCQPRRKITVLPRDGEWRNMGEFNANFMHIGLARSPLLRQPPSQIMKVSASTHLASHCHIIIR